MLDPGPCQLYPFEFGRALRDVTVRETPTDEYIGIGHRFVEDFEIGRRLWS